MLLGFLTSRYIQARMRDWSGEWRVRMLLFFFRASA